MTKTGFPPVPQVLREILKNYPELIDQLQQALNRVVEKPAKGTPPFEVAIWVLEDVLSAFIVEARKELSFAEASDDPDAITHAKAKKFAVGYARANMGGFSELRDYFDSWSRP